MMDDEPRKPVASPHVPDRLVTLTQIAEAVRVPRDRAENWAQNRLRKVPPFPPVARRIGNTNTYHWSDVQKWFKAAGFIEWDQPE